MSTRPRVFVVQNTHLLAGDGKLVPKFNMSDAKRYGTLIDLLGPSARPHESGHVIRELRDKLSSFGDDDYLLLVGNPALIGFAVGIAAEANEGRVRLLQWDGVERRYREIVADLLFAQPSTDRRY